MKIKGRTCIVYDVESLRNIFTCTCKNTETNEIITFEISVRKNDLLDMVNYFLNRSYIFIGYNNHHYDNILMNYCIAYSIYQGNPLDFVRSLFNLTGLIIREYDTAYDSFKKFKYAKSFFSVDLLTMLYSTALRVSLKEIQITMQYHNVQEFHVDWNEDLPIEQFDSLISYNINDVESTTFLLNECKNNIDIRLAIEQEYGFECLSVDPVNLGMELLRKEYHKDTGIDPATLCIPEAPEFLDLSKIILDKVSFKTEIFSNMLKYLKKQVVSPGRKGLEYTFIYKGLKYSVGVGGLHSINKPEIIIPNEDEILLDIDVASLYPSLLIEYGFYPDHLGEEFSMTYSKVRSERLEAKHNGNKIKDATLKLALNGLSGNLQNPYSWAYSPSAVMKIRMNGQMFLLMLAEQLTTKLNCRIVQVNTDGIFLVLKKNDYEIFKGICSDWEKHTRLTLEETQFEALYQFAINDYFALEKGYNETKDPKKIKQKGMFITKVILGKGLSPKIIPEAVIKFFAEGIPIEKTIKECLDIRKFLMAEKTGKQWNVEYLDKPQQRTNRFFASNNGAYLWKWKMTDTKQYQNMLAGYGVTLLNKLPDITFDNQEDFKNYFDVNYNYYTHQARKIINELRPLQLSLF